MNIMINKEDLLEYGMEEKDNNPVYPLQKNLTKDGKMSIVVSMINNKPELALMLPNGDSLYLMVDSIEQLEAFEKSIERWEPNY